MNKNIQNVDDIINILDKENIFYNNILLLGLDVEEMKNKYKITFDKKVFSK